MPINFDLSRFDEMLFKQGIDLITCFGLFVYNQATHEITESPNETQVRDSLGKMIIPTWLSFCAGYELLFKAVLAKHKALNVSKGKVSNREKNDLLGDSSNPARILYSFVRDSYVTAPSNDYLNTELLKNKIVYVHDFSTGQLGSAIGNLKKLLDIGIITIKERAFLNDATWALLDIRRNIDAHTFFGLIVGKSINGDLENLYLPAINVLITAYYRSTS